MTAAETVEIPAAETVEIPISKGPQYEGAAIFLAALAYPSDRDRRKKFRIAYCRKWLRRRASEDCEFANSESIIRHEYFLFSDKLIEDEFNAGQDQLVQRKKAVISTWALFEEKLCGRPVRLTGFKDYNLSVNAANRHDLTLYWAQQNGASESNRKNITERSERPARPVIHAAYALWRTVLEIWEQARREGVTTVDSAIESAILENRNLLARVIERSEFMRPIAASISELKVSAPEQIRFVAI